MKLIKCKNFKNMYVFFHSLVICMDLTMGVGSFVGASVGYIIGVHAQKCQSK